MTPNTQTYLQEVKERFKNAKECFICASACIIDTSREGSSCALPVVSATDLAKLVEAVEVAMAAIDHASDHTVEPDTRSNLDKARSKIERIFTG